MSIINIIENMHRYSHSSSPTSFMAPTPPPTPTLTQVPYEDGYINLFYYPPACRSSVTIRPNTSFPSSSTNNGHQSVVSVLTPHIITPFVDQGSRNGVSRHCWDMVMKMWKRCVRGFRAVFLVGVLNMCEIPAL